MADVSPMPEPPVLARRARVRDQLARRGITPGVLALCLLWLVAVGPVVHDMTAQGAPRFALTGALVDDRDIKIDGYLVGYDKAERDGHTYSDKAPGQEFLAVPVYAAARAVGAEPAAVPRVTGNLTLWWVTAWSAGLPAVAVMVLAAAAAHRRGRAIPLPALGALAFGTMLLPFSANLYGHVLGAALGFAAWSAIDVDDPGWRRGALAGALLGAAVSVEYQVAIVGVVLGGLLVIRRRWAALGALVLACVPFAGALLAYQAAAFGSPLSSGYTGKAAHSGASLFITGVPDPVTLFHVLVGSRGILLFTPVVGVGIWGLVQRWRRHRDAGAAVALWVVAGFLLLQAGWPNPWGGDGPGPRYVTPMLPFLAIGLAEVWRELRPALRRWVVGISLASMVLPTLTMHLVTSKGPLIATHLRSLREEGLNPTVWSIALGPAGSVLYGVTVAGAAALVVRAVRSDAPATDRPPVTPSRGAGAVAGPGRATP